MLTPTTARRTTDPAGLADEPSSVENVKAPGTASLIVHGHFYQPPRENPFTGTLPREQGAEPYHDFNEKINAECYRPNAALGNFGLISFNLGPTLAAWLEKTDPDTYTAIIAADRDNYARDGVGNAMAQAYNHTILPLAAPHDAQTQIAWGIADFRQRFGHAPEGMWLAETACNTAILEALAEQGIRFTILAPWQADTATVQVLDTPPATYDQIFAPRHAPLHGQPDTYDVNEPFIVELSGGRSIVVFFYNGKLSGDVSFSDQATSDAGRFAHDWLLPQVDSRRSAAGLPQQIMIATDGELYGHHKHFRDLFLCSLTQTMAAGAGLDVTWPGRYLRQHPPRRSIKIVDNSSWSCHHGIARWGQGCGCTGDMWQTKWKTPLRTAFDTMAAAADGIFEKRAPGLFHDPTRALHQFITVWTGNSSEEGFLRDHLLPDADGDIALRLLRMQVYKHQMYTSCAWFFEDVERIEPKNALAAAAITLKLLARDVPPESRLIFYTALDTARSWRTGNSALRLYRSGIRANAKS